jgi:hypothetical protein
MQESEFRIQENATRFWRFGRFVIGRSIEIPSFWSALPCPYRFALTIYRRGRRCGGGLFGHGGDMGIIDVARTAHQNGATLIERSTEGPRKMSKYESAWLAGSLNRAWQMVALSQRR